AALLLSGNFAFSQNVTFDTYKITNVGSIKIPNNMEIQSDEYKRMVEQKISNKGYEISGNKIVFQVKGTNNLETKAVNSYARVILQTEIGRYGDYPSLTSNQSYSQSDLDASSYEIQTMLAKQLQANGQKLVKWNGITMVKVNGITAMKCSYQRQDGDFPYAVVNMYQFFNNDRVHTLTLSYRHTEESTWKPLFEKVLNSFTITNVR
ncbi:MAG: hypothetical protein LBC49_02305, partial [Bacteroidales bacterium]|nr:hypothetical protein [Bacteroidales bacterium]